MNHPDPLSQLTRREAIARLALVLGGTMVGAQVFLHGEPLTGKSAGPGFSAAAIALLDEIGETIIPATHTPGAKAAGIGAFMAQIVQDCYDESHQAIFQDGLVKLEEECVRQCGKTFQQALPAERTALLNRLDAAARPKQNPVHYFRMFKELTVLGYFTSEIGCTQALRFVESPGSFNGSVPYAKGDRAWFSPPNHFIRS